MGIYHLSVNSNSIDAYSASRSPLPCRSFLLQFLGLFCVLGLLLCSFFLLPLLPCFCGEIGVWPNKRAAWMGDIHGVKSTYHGEGFEGVEINLMGGNGA